MSLKRVSWGWKHRSQSPAALSKQPERSSFLHKHCHSPVLAVQSGSPTSLTPEVSFVELAKCTEALGLRGPMIPPQDIKILHLPLAWWETDELCLVQLEIKLFQVYNIYCSPWGWLRMWATHFWLNGTGEDSRASTSALYLWVSSKKLYWIHILHPSLWRIQLTFTVFLFSGFQ